MKDHDILQELARVKVKDIINKIKSQKSLRLIKNKTQKITSSIQELKIAKQQELTKSSHYISRAVRVKVFTRDNYQCVGCYRNSQQTKLQIDCIVSFSQGGSNNIDNLQTLCVDCNSQNSERIVANFA